MKKGRHDKNMAFLFDLLIKEIKRIKRQILNPNDAKLPYINNSCLLVAKRIDAV